MTVDVHHDKRGTAYRQWQRSVDVAEATLFDIEMVPLSAPDTPLHPLTTPLHLLHPLLHPHTPLQSHYAHRPARRNLVIATHRRRASREYRLSSARSPEAPS